MLQFSKYKITLILAVILAGLYTAAPNLFSESELQRLPSWLPARTVSLGLDLQGGSHLLYEVDTAALVKERLENATSSVREALRGEVAPHLRLGMLPGGDAAEQLEHDGIADGERAVRLLGGEPVYVRVAADPQR